MTIHDTTIFFVIVCEIAMELYIMKAKDVICMQCGAKCFIVEVELDGEKKSFPVTARSSVSARKAVRLQYADAVKIVSVKQENH